MNTKIRYRICVIHLDATDFGTDSAHIDKTLQELAEKLSFSKDQIELLRFNIHVVWLEIAE